MSQLGILGGPSNAALPPPFQDAVSVALGQPAGWAPLRPDLLDALIRDSLPAAHSRGAFASSPLGRFLRTHAGRPLVLWYAGDLTELDQTHPETLLETARRQLLDSASLGGELYLNHAPLPR